MTALLTFLLLAYFGIAGGLGWSVLWADDYRRRNPRIWVRRDWRIAPPFRCRCGHYHRPRPPRNPIPPMERPFPSFFTVRMDRLLEEHLHRIRSERQRRDVVGNAP